MGAISTMALDRQDAAVGSPQQRFETLLNTHRGIVFKVASIYCRDVEEQRDLAQEIRAQAWRAYPRYDASRSFSTWMYRIALNVAISFRRVPHLLAAGLALHLFGVATICISVMQILLIGRAFYTAPVVTIQRRLAELYRFRVVSSLALGLTWWVLWIAATMVGAKLWFGIDLYGESPQWIQWSLGAGVLGMAASVALARRFADRQTSSLLLRNVIDNLAGRSLLRASRRLDEIAQFERG